MKFLIVIAVLFLSGCGALVDDDKVVAAVKKQGYSGVSIKEKHVVFVGYRGCSDSDAAAYKVVAKNAKGNTVDLIVCAGWPFKGVTIRTEGS